MDNKELQALVDALAILKKARYDSIMVCEAGWRRAQHAYDYIEKQVEEMISF